MTNQLRPIVFRCDASLKLGSGHVMRCLTLADALSGNGRECVFVCRTLPGHMMEHITARGYRVCVLPSPSSSSETGHSTVPLAEEIHQVREVLASIRPTWIVVDHYDLDATWESAVASDSCKVMVIDDLADRPHVCDMLLDQNLGRNPGDYRDLLPDGCIKLIGPKYALLRPEFAYQRAASLKRREEASLQRILISMGGMDADNFTEAVLDHLATFTTLPRELRLTVVMGRQAPYLDDVRQRARTMPWPTEVCVDVSNMATLMQRADLAIGAAGSTSWERCCLGLPTLMFVLADNQIAAAAALDAAGGAVTLPGLSTHDDIDHLELHLTQLTESKQQLRACSDRAAQVVDGHGTERVIASIMKATPQ